MPGISMRFVTRFVRFSWRLSLHLAYMPRCAAERSARSQILRGQDNRFAQACERYGAEAGKQGFLAAAEYDLDALGKIAVPDNVMMQWMDTFAVNASEDSTQAKWAQAGALVFFADALP